MKKVKLISENENFTAISIGTLNELAEHSFVHPKFSTTDTGRLFVGELLATTGAEISFRELPAQTTIPFLHKHKTHEEIYIILRGNGKFQVDEDVFEIGEGSIIRVSPEGNRTLKNEGKEKMIYLVIQAKAGTLSNYNVLDGYREEGMLRL